MDEPSKRYDVTVAALPFTTMLGSFPNPAEFTILAEQPASSRNPSIVSAHMADQIISVITVRTADQSLAVAIALAIVSEALVLQQYFVTYYP